MCACFGSTVLYGGNVGIPEYPVRILLARYVTCKYILYIVFTICIGRVVGFRSLDYASSAIRADQVATLMELGTWPRMSAVSS